VTHQSDRLLAARMLRGEETAFEEFFRDNFARLFRFAMTRLNHDCGAAEEAVQATLCRAVSSLQGYRGEASLFTWLCSICRNEIHAWRERRGAAHREVELTEDAPAVRAALETLAASASAAQGPEESLRRRELGRLVQVALDCLPPSYGDVLEWKYIEGLPVKEIAARLNLGPKAAESLLTRARQAFREGFAVLMETPGRIGREPRRT
jgi:RNA polymerase sigma-70 factor (ECF subfamily)